MYTPDDCAFVYWFIGFAIVLGGCACCAAAGCSHCTDGTEDATLQVDVTGVAADLDTSSCCTTLNRTYILAIDPSNTCRFTISYENGDCATAACSQCDSSGCTVTCDESPSTLCDPAGNPETYCSFNGTVSYGGDCPTCAGTESSVINPAEGSGIALACVCTCEPTGLFWDVDIAIIDHPEATWAVANDEVYSCACNADDCTARVGKSSTSLTVVIGESGGNARVTITGSMLSRSITGSYDFTGDPVDCATEMNALALTAGASGGGFDVEFGDCSTPGSCLCDPPTGLDLTYIP